MQAGQLRKLEDENDLVAQRFSSFNWKCFSLFFFFFFPSNILVI